MAVPIRFGSDVDRATELMARVANDVCAEYQQEAAEIWADMSRKYSLEPATTEPMITFVFDENWMTFTVRYAVRFDKRRSTKHQLSAKILTETEATGNVVSIAATALEIISNETLRDQPKLTSQKVRLHYTER